MKNIIVVCLIIMGLFSCKTERKSSYQKIIKNISRNYDGLLEVSQGFILNSEDKKRYYEISLDKSKILDAFDELSVPASNIATLVYQSFENNQKENVSEIKIKLKTKNGRSYKDSFDLGSIVSFLAKKDFFKKIKDKVVLRKYDEIYSLLAEEAKKKTSEDSFLKIFKDYDYSFGYAKDFIQQGFTIGNLDLNEENISIINYLGTIVRENKNTQISIFLNEETNEIYSISFEW